MKKEWVSAAAGIGLLLLAAITFMCFCRYMDGKERSDQNIKDTVYSLFGDDEQYWGFEDEDGRTAAGRGFAVYKQLPESVTKLLDTGIFAPSEEKAQKFREVYDEDVDQESATTIDSLQSDYESVLEDIQKMGTESYLEKVGYIGPNAGNDIYCFLNWDKGAGKFADTDKIAEIESCGFSGFSDLIAQAEKMIQNRRAEAANESGVYYDDMQCKIYCQGFEFDLVWCNSKDDYRLQFPMNTAVCYIPEKYRNVIDGVAALGGYVPYYYCIGGKKEVLIFNRDNSIECSNAGPRGDDDKGARINKRIALIFEDGKIVDYYVTTDRKKLQLDDTDQKIIKQYTSGLGKTLSERGEQYNVNMQQGFWLYRAK